MHLFTLLPALLYAALASLGAEPSTLKLLISLEQQTVRAPFPARITLHLHNAGSKPAWLYRRARSESREGSSVEVRLEPGEGRGEIATPAQGRVLESAGLPRPKLVRLPPDEDYEEKTLIRLAPALAASGSENKPLWGRYRLSIKYAAKYSNVDELERILGVMVWRGEVTSNTIEVELQPPDGAGSVAGRVVGSDSRPVTDALVSLSDQQERLVDQVLTESEGRFSFTHLPLGLYWVTARLVNSTEDTAVFRHLLLTAAEPAGTIELAMLPPEIYEANKLLHKPVLLRVTDNAGRPAGKVGLEVVWSNGTVVDSVKGEVAGDGTAALELIPGRNFVTLKRRGCPKEEHRVDLAAGGGIDGFSLVFECTPR